MGAIVEWQSLKMQEYRYGLLIGIARLFAIFGVRRPVTDEKPVAAGDYDFAVHSGEEGEDSFLSQYLDVPPVPHIGGQPNVTATPEMTPTSNG